MIWSIRTAGAKRWIGSTPPTNFPEFTGRVCPAPCEGSCILGLIEPPVTIKSIECAIIDKGFEEGWVVAQPPAVRTGKRVAVVGSGPAGLACAAQLNSAGHRVTVYERADRIGGLLMYGIPNMKLEKERVEQRVDLMRAEGVTSSPTAKWAKTFPPTVSWQRTMPLCSVGARPTPVICQLRAESWKASILRWSSCTAIQSRYWTASMAKFQVKASAIHLFLQRAKTLLLLAAATPATTAWEPQCATAATAPACSKSFRSPPPDRAPDNPWPEWPRIFRVDYGHAEAARASAQTPAPS